MRRKTDREEKIACCGTDKQPSDLVERVSQNMPNEVLLNELSDFFKVFGDPTRTKILWALDESELCVCDLGSVLGMTKSAVSHQLSTLRKANLVKFRRVGKNVFYSLKDEHVKTILEIGMEHIQE
ncbi:MAG: metalloregulator ArsR/SmtB family transcription factor [Peptostreptococcaceae bacterium]|nr:metalloregulator ArsR/SmtB family transcription factor [Peptostreptococcaceae bacterium]